MAREGLEEKCKFLGETNLFFLVLLLERTHGTLNSILYNVLDLLSHYFLLLGRYFQDQVSGGGTGEQDQGTGGEDEGQEHDADGGSEGQDTHKAGEGTQAELQQYMHCKSDLTLLKMRKLKYTHIGVCTWV